MKDKEKIDILHEFTPRSQYSCSKCTTYKRVKDPDDIVVGSHICFESNLTFYHAIISEIHKTDNKQVQLGIIHASRFEEQEIVRKIFGKAFQQHDVIVQENLPEISLETTPVYIVSYSRRTYPVEKVFKRARSLVQREHGKNISTGTLSDQRIRPEACFRNLSANCTSEQFSSWCTTGENVCLNTSSNRKCIEYNKDSDDIISMKLLSVSDSDPVKCATRFHQRHLLCDACFLTELVILVNETKDPARYYNLVPASEAAWVNERKIPNGLYRVIFLPLDREVIIKIKRYNSKFKRLALVVNTERFVFTLDTGRKCEKDEPDVKFKFPYPFWKIPSDSLYF